MTKPKVRIPGRGIVRLAQVLVVTGVGAVVMGVSLFRMGYVVSVQSASSMEPTVLAGERVVAERIDGDEVERGDVVLFADPRWFPGGELALKRVIAAGGDRVTCCEGGGVRLNGEPLVEPYVKNGDPVGGLAPGMPGGTYGVTVPQGRLFVLGDHRANSMDSRFRFDAGASGTVASDTVRARVLEDGFAGRPLLLLGMVVLGVLMALSGGILALAARFKRRSRPVTGR